MKGDMCRKFVLEQIIPDMGSVETTKSGRIIAYFSKTHGGRVFLSDGLARALRQILAKKNHKGVKGGRQVETFQKFPKSFHFDGVVF